MQIIHTKTADLIPYINNARTHSELQINQIIASIKEFGFTNPILTDGDNGIIAGHCRLMAAKKMGMEEVPTIELSHLSDAQRKAYILADNKLALNSGWDNELLKIELAELDDLGFDLELIGFDPSEIQFNEIDYSILDEEDVNKIIDDLEGGVKKAIQIEFEAEHYDEARELVKFWRDQSAYIGYMLIELLRNEKEKI